jgi:hypothetical protein
VLSKLAASVKEALLWKYSIVRDEETVGSILPPD